MTFSQMDGTWEVARDMTDENITRNSRTPTQTFVHLVIVSLVVCLLAALGTIVGLVFQRTGSCPQCGLKYSPQNTSKPHTMPPDSRSPEKAAAYLKVMKPINQSRLRWIKDILYNMIYEEKNGTLVIQQPGTYFIYCHLHFYISLCPDKTSDLKLEICVNEISLKQTLLTLCSCDQTANGTYHDLFQVLLITLKKGNRIAVNVEMFEYVDTDVLYPNNVLGAFRYNGDDEGLPLLQTLL
ncbi:tumor necrosis factor ligand superfamily member 8 [Paroedura picta]|uniref:tumor necrosis factor ligand superfamily member 8 n=1 Tax=Paroedura picta TaxID=143630 RepID=UPI004055EF58